MRGDLKLVKWLHARGFELNNYPMEDAAIHGRLDILKWFHETQPTRETTSETMDNAAINNHLVLLQWIHENRREDCSEEAIVLAAQRGHLEIVQWLHDHRPEFQNRQGGCTPDVMDYAAQDEHLEVVQWLHEHRVEDARQEQRMEQLGAATCMLSDGCMRIRLKDAQSTVCVTLQLMDIVWC